jgi:glycosyltransferase involved in cell wall biosynthesis
MEFEILTANYNNSNFLDDFFLSIINSSLKPKSIIFVDDCSTDNSLEIVEKYQNMNCIDIKLIINPKNIGFANSLNIAITYLSTFYFARLDPDDSVHKDRFLIQQNYLIKNPEIDLLGTNVTYFLNNKSIRISDVYIGKNNIKRAISNGILPIIHGSIMGKSAVIKDFKYNQKNVPSEDYDLFAYLISKNYYLENITNSLTNVSIHVNSVSNDIKFETIKKRYDLARDYFNFKRNSIYIKLDFYHMFFYRRYLFNSTKFKYYYFFISACCKPFKSIKKIIFLIGRKLFNFL